ncbi:AraC family transcriptional regulator [Gracilibacillus massiliensis]|uniref:AraC family transcriptional regulator n=1 Tax=Gracilibacillus massiliensis TaxID=1564956 RepID=UPI00071E29D8|nr:AraC family transcriptional regulator [Gracilibacillus massiliensis]
MLSYSQHSSYGFRFKGQHQERVAGLHSIGKEIRTNHSYRWDGLTRGEYGRVVFQYTLSGQGAIQIGNNIYSLKKGEAFFVKLPSDHCYFLPDNSDKWEFVYITVYGEEALQNFEWLTEKYGHLFKMPSHSRPIKHILRMLEITETVGINHSYEASGFAYSFLMELTEYLEYEQQKKGDLPLAVAKAVTFLDTNYTKDISLNDIVAVSGLSKYHFTRLFSNTLNETPIQYLTKIRMERALDLLQHTDQSIEHIARSVGYSSSNYFSKVFKNALKETPSSYRQNKSVMPVDRLFID